MNWINCHECGRFVQADADQSTPFGTSTDYEPPDPHFYCERCATRLEERAVANKAAYMLNDWCKADWQRRAAKRLGLVECGPKGAAWTHFCKAVPEGWEAR